jgi:glutathione S-transferase
LTYILVAPFLVRVYYALDGEIIPEWTTFKSSDFPKLGKYVQAVTTHEKIREYVAPRLGFLNFYLTKLNENKDLKLKYPLDLTPLEDSQGLKNLYILDADTGKPRTNKNHLRIYGHPLCPFVERAKLAFKAKGVQYQFVGIDLTEKNKWHKDINGGLVPFLETPEGEIIIESTGVADWVQEHFKDGVNLYPGDESNQKAIKESVESLFKPAIDIIIAVFKHDERKADGATKYVKGLEALNTALEESSTNFFNNQNHETMADLMTFPFVHRAFLVEGTFLKEDYYDEIDFDKIAKLKKWYDAIAEKYQNQLGLQLDFMEHLHRNMEAAGPKVQLYYPIPSES